ncbi:MAG: hypothetical protein LUD50_00995 [Clostridia bacterium]|nr:hypothetical protein [Clostridia bacterium]
MRKRFFAVLITAAVALAAFAACLGAAGCSEEDANDKDMGTLIVETKRDVGEYSGYEVWYARYYYAGSEVNAVVKPIEIDDVYIFSAPDPSYSYVVVMGEGKYLLLSEAYEQELVTHDDLEAIAATEAKYDGNRQYEQDTSEE